MLFYEDFVKKIESEKNIEVKNMEKFSVELKRLVGGLGIGIPLLLAGIYQGYMATLGDDVKVFSTVFALIFLFLGLKQLKTTLMYKINVDTVKKILAGEKLVLDLNVVESCTLKEAKMGKNLQVILDIITTNKRQIIIPLYMKNKERFVLVMKTLLNEKFFIKK